jgi:hypothetical protein
MLYDTCNFLPHSPHSSLPPALLPLSLPILYSHSEPHTQHTPTHTHTNAHQHTHTPTHTHTGLTAVHGMDYSPTACTMMQRRAEQGGYSIGYFAGDARRMPEVRSGHYDLLLDKGTLDAIASGDAEAEMAGKGKVRGCLGGVCCMLCAECTVHRPCSNPFRRYPTHTHTTHTHTHTHTNTHTNTLTHTHTHSRKPQTPSST